MSTRLSWPPTLALLVLAARKFGLGLDPDWTKEAATSAAAPCQHCNTPGGGQTFRNQACMPINGRVQCIDFCIHQIVAALNAGGITTVASCCGHEVAPGRIDLEDGRTIVIVQNANQIVWQSLGGQS